uniref:NADP-dependent oxidoreductase domain-containing protein n=2 Tax=Aegilops tauschii subsp. strangulata TaxID=200361 RepID=A0A453BNB0_AEGTS
APLFPWPNKTRALRCHSPRQEHHRAAPTCHASGIPTPTSVLMALQVAGGPGCCGCLPLLGQRPTAAFRPPRAVASEGAAVEDGSKVMLGGSGVAVTKLGIGAWSWGDTTYWNDFQWDDRKLKDAKGAFDASVDSGITFFDTAEVYGAGVSGAINSESLLGRFIKERKEKEGVEVAIATKFAALPWRFGRGSVISALKGSLSRLGVSSVESYQLHWLVVHQYIALMLFVTLLSLLKLFFSYPFQARDMGQRRLP